MFKHVFAMFATVVIGLILIVVLFGNGPGVVGVSGYEHAIAICGDDLEDVVHVGEAVVWADGIATYVVNAGHDMDPEVDLLVDAAEKECAKYSE